MITWKNSAEDEDTIHRIVDRAVGLLKDRPSRLYLTMDISCTHAIGCPLNLPGLLAATDFDFLHDIAGIRINLDRGTGMLLNGFRPRYARAKI